MLKYLRDLIEPYAAMAGKWVSGIRRPATIINDEHVIALKALLIEGDVLASCTKYEFSNAFIPGFYTHAAIYLDGSIYEAVTGGVRKSSLEHFCFKKDGIALLRLQGPDWTPEQLVTMKKFVTEQLGEPYDFEFEWGPIEKWYCSKLVLFTFQEAAPESASAIKTVKILGEKNVTPQNLVESLDIIGKFGEQK